jgi:excisionase family DNA binding protein
LEGLTGVKSDPTFKHAPSTEFLLPSDAAERLGVAVGTVRNWIKAGKLRAKRHPVNHYRLTMKCDVEGLARAINSPVKS